MFRQSLQHICQATLQLWKLPMKIYLALFPCKGYILHYVQVNNTLCLFPSLMPNPCQKIFADIKFDIRICNVYMWKWLNIKHFQFWYQQSFNIRLSDCQLLLKIKNVVEYTNYERQSIKDFPTVSIMALSGVHIHFEPIKPVPSSCM